MGLEVDEDGGGEGEGEVESGSESEADRWKVEVEVGLIPDAVAGTDPEAAPEAEVSAAVAVEMEL